MTGTIYNLQVSNYKLLARTGTIYNLQVSNYKLVATS